MEINITIYTNSLLLCRVIEVQLPSMIQNVNLLKKAQGSYTNYSSAIKVPS